MTARGRERSARARAGGECRVSASFSGFSPRVFEAARRGERRRRTTKDLHTAREKIENREPRTARARKGNGDAGLGDERDHGADAVGERARAEAAAIVRPRGDGARKEVGEGPKREHRGGSRGGGENRETDPLDRLAEIVRTGDEIE